MCQQRVLHCWQRCELVGEYDIPGRLLCLLEAVPSMATLSATKALPAIRDGGNLMAASAGCGSRCSRTPSKLVSKLSPPK